MTSTQTVDTAPSLILEQDSDAAQQNASADVIFDARHARQNSIIILAVLAVVYSLYFGRDLLLPVMMATVLSLLLQPLMRVLKVHLRLPVPLAALVIIILVFVAMTGIAYMISIQSRNWAERAPEGFTVLKEKLAFLSGPITYAQEVLHSIEHIGANAGQSSAPVTVAQNDALPGIILFGTASTFQSFFTIIVILYFMLASGDRLLRGLIEVLPTFRDKRRVVEIAAEIQSNISSYLMTVTVMNTIVGLATGLAMFACGLADPILWGSVAFILNFVPIIGPLIGIVIFFIAGLLALSWPFPALAPMLLYLAIHLVEGQAVTPLLVARRFELNPVFVILSLFFWHFMWGIPGALLAVPLLAMFKIFADRIEPLKGVGHLLGA